MRSGGRLFEDQRGAVLQLELAGRVSVLFQASIPADSWLDKRLGCSSNTPSLGTLQVGCQGFGVKDNRYLKVAVVL